MSVAFRKFAWSDVPAITQIYRHAVETSVATFDTEAPGETFFAEKFGHMIDLGSGDDVGIKAVLPGRRKEDEFVRTADDGPGQLVDVLADAGSLPKRGSIVEQDSHGRGFAMLSRPFWSGADAASPLIASGRQHFGPHVTVWSLVGDKEPHVA